MAMSEWMGRWSVSGYMAGCCGIEDDIAGPGTIHFEPES